MSQFRWAEAPNKYDLWDNMYAQRHFPWDMLHTSQELVTATLVLGLPKGATVLDVGCGAGSDLLFLAAGGYRATGLDVSRVALSIADQRLKAAGLVAELVHGDALNLPFPDAGFDLISDRGCFHHVRNADRPQYAREMTRVLKPGGHFLLRGCRVEGLEWVPVTENEICALFSREHFLPPRVAPFRYDARVPIDALMVWMEKRAG